MCALENRKRQTVQMMIMVVVTMITMLFCCASTSPIYPYYNCTDSSIFILIGKGITEGKLCYVDLFDHKGPVLFFLEAFGWTICGRAGIWLLECAAMLASELAIIGICRLLKAKPWLPIAASAAVLFFTFCYGNLTEDYSLPLIYFSLYLGTRYFVSQQDRHPLRYAVVYGICIGLIAFIRVNNALIIFALILGILIDLIRKKKYGNIAANLLAGSAGIALVAVPVCLYFYRHDALYDMLYATFLYNLNYTGETAHLSLWKNARFFFVLYSPAVFSVIIFALQIKNKQERPLILTLLIASGLSLLMLLYANAYDHYFTLSIPVFTIAAAMTAPDPKLKSLFRFPGQRNLKLALLGVIVLGFAGFSAYRGAVPFYQNLVTGSENDRYEQMNESAEVIPEDERDSVLGLGIPVKWYLDMDITPCYKYYAMQEWWTTSENDVYGETVEYVETDHPLWLITKKDDDYGVDELDDSYELVDENDYASVYRYAG